MDEIMGRHAFVTGGAHGIGLAVAHALADAGARVTLADLDAAALGEAVAQRPADFAAIELDVRDRAAWVRAKAAAQERFGPVDILVNNAGIGPDGRSLADTEPESFDRILAINVTGAFNGISTFAADMRDRRSGHIINTSSGGGFFTLPAKGPYAASKFAVVALSECLRDELKPFGVGVSVLAPGPTESRLVETTRALGSEVSDATLRWTPAMRTAEEVGRRTVAGLLAGEAYIFTDPTDAPRAALVTRYEAIIEAFDRQAKADSRTRTSVPRGSRSTSRQEERES